MEAWKEPQKPQTTLIKKIMAPKKGHQAHNRLRQKSQVHRRHHLARQAQKLSLRAVINKLGPVTQPGRETNQKSAARFELTEHKPHSVRSHGPMRRRYGPQMLQSGS